MGFSVLISESISILTINNGLVGIKELTMRSTQAMKAYHQADREAAAESERPHEMISVLFDELIRRMEAFKANMLDDSKEKIEERSQHYGRSISLLHALQMSLDFEKGGEIANNLFKLYEYSRYQLLNCLQSGEMGGLEVSIASLKEIREAWQKMPG